MNLEQRRTLLESQPASLRAGWISMMPRLIWEWTAFLAATWIAFVYLTSSHRNKIAHITKFVQSRLSVRPPPPPSLQCHPNSPRLLNILGKNPSPHYRNLWPIHPSNQPTRMNTSPSTSVCRIQTPTSQSGSSAPITTTLSAGSTSSTIAAYHLSRRTSKATTSLLLFLHSIISTVKSARPIYKNTSSWNAALNRIAASTHGWATSTPTNTFRCGGPESCPRTLNE